MKYEIGENLIYTTDEFDGFTQEKCKVTEVHDDYCIATSESGLALWIDEDTEFQFKRA